MTGWTSQAHALADAIREPGFTCADICATAWSAHVDPAAVRGLVGAAMTLTSGDAGPRLWATADPCPSDSALLEAVTELEGATAQLLGYASGMARDCRATLEAAMADAAAAHATLNSGTSPPAQAAAGDTLAAARAAIADCEAAMEVINEAGTRLAHAANCLRKVPDDLAITYETPYAHIRDGGTLPHDGEFLTGGISYEAA